MAKKLAKLIPNEDAFKKLSEGVQEFYEKQADGTYVLESDDTDLKTKLDEFRTNNRALNSEKQSLIEKMKLFEGIDPETYKRAQQALAHLEDQEERELLKAGKIDEVFARRTAKLKADHDAEMKALRKLADTREASEREFRTKYGYAQLQGQLDEVLSKIGKLRPTAREDVLLRARAVFQINEKGGFDPKDFAGKTIYGKDAEPITPGEWAQQLLQTAPHLFEPGQGGGSKGGEKGGSPGDVKVINANDPLAFGRNVEKIAKGEVVVAGMNDGSPS